MIRRAKASEISRLLEITQACATHMITEGIFQWNEHYPSRLAFDNDVDRDELYVYEKGHEIIGCIVISTFKDEEYQSVSWLTKDSIHYYIHRLAVHPEFQSQGIAQELMNYAEAKARQANIASIRLDTFSQNKRNQRFYEQRGYKRLGDIYFPKQSVHPFHCYELVLK